MANFYKGTFTAPGATGNQATTGIGFQPAALLIWTTWQTATGFADGILWGLGATDGTRQECIAGAVADAAATSASRRAASNARLIDIYNSSSTNLGRATIVSLDADGFTVNWSVVDGAGGQVLHVVAFGSVDAYVSEFAIVARYAADPIPFRAQALLNFPSSGAPGGLAVTTDFVTGAFGFSCVDPTEAYQQNCMSAGVQNGQAASNSAKYQRSDITAHQFGSTLATSQEYGFGASLGYRLVTNNDEMVPYLALAGVRCKGGVANQPTSTGTQAISGLGFTPKLVIIGSDGHVTSSSIQNDADFSLGAGDGTRQGLIYFGDTDAADPMVNVTRHVTDKIVTMSTPNATAASSTTEAEASLQSLDADGFTLNWTTADATAREWWWIAFGDEATAATGGIEHVSSFVGLMA